MHTKSSFLSFVFLCYKCMILCVLTKIDIAYSQQEDKWTSQFNDMKTMLIRLDTKLSSLDTKIGSLNALEFAFKTNNIDNHLRNIDSKITNLEQMLENVQEGMRNVQGGGCPGSHEVAPGRAQSADRPGAIRELMEKLDDYAKKGILNHRELLESVEQHKNSLTLLHELVQSGFNKLSKKLDQFMAMEGQLTVLVQSTTSWSPRLNQVSEQQTDLTNDIMELKSKVENNGRKLTNLTGELAEIVQNPRMQGGEGVVDAYNITLLKTRQREVKDSMKHFSNLEPDIARMAALARQLEASLKARNPGHAARLRNLTASLAAMEREAIQLSTSTLRKFNEFDELLNNVFAVIGSNFSCECQEKLLSELEFIRNTLQGGSVALDPANNKGEEFLNTIHGMPNSLQGSSVFSQINSVSSKLRTLKGDLRRLFANCSIADGGNKGVELIIG